MLSRGRVRLPKPRTSSLPEAESLAALVSLLASLPPSSQVEEQNGTQQLSDRPAKRAKTSHTTDAVLIARETLTLPPRKTAEPLSTHLERQNVGTVVNLHITEHFDFEKQQVERWDLTLSPKTKKSSWRVKYDLRAGALSDKLAVAIEVAMAYGVPTDSIGFVWTSFDVAIAPGDDLALVVTFEVRWNETSSTLGNSSVLQYQQKLRDLVVRHWWPNLAQRVAPLRGLWNSQKLTPQDFYSAAFIPDQDDSIEIFDMEIPNLTATLYPFQRRAVHWLLQREGVRWCKTSTNDSTDGRTDGGHVKPLGVPCGLPISFTEVKNPKNETFYISPLFSVVTRDLTAYRQMQDIRGGILAEEMGLGKSLECISLILLHRDQRPREHGMASANIGGLRTTGATLIITPSTLLDQWLSELKKHSPNLTVMLYPGLKTLIKGKWDEATAVDRMANHDVVITTYEVLRTELHFALEPPQRSMRRERGYKRPKCPLVQLSWWRLCIDEAQMVESGVSNAAQMVRMITRQNSWAITGTPVKNVIGKDLRGLLTFLGFEPYASDNRIWDLVTSRDRETFCQLFNLICIRHTKALVRNEIAIPPQKRYVITMPFTAVEEQHYQSLFKSLVEVCGLDVNGNPITDSWDFEDDGVEEAMRKALDRLRQTALHPEIGNQNRRALGHKIGPMRTVADVLNAMVEQSETMLRTEHRNLLMMRLTRGQILAGLHRVKDAVTLWEDVLQASNKSVADCRAYLQQEVEEAKRSDELQNVGGVKSRGRDEADRTDSSDESQDAIDLELAGTSRVGEARRRLRSALEVEHKAMFFCANGYFSIKLDEELTQPETEDFQRLLKLETDGYEKSRVIRHEILQEIRCKAQALMAKIQDLADRQKFAVIPGFMFSEQRGIESSRILDAQKNICARLNMQAAELGEWRERIIQLLLKPLVDEEEEEVTGAEYEQSTQVQDEIQVFVQILGIAISDRQTTLSGQQNERIEVEIKTAFRLASNGDGPFPEKFLQLFAKREKIKHEFVMGGRLCSTRGVISELRALSLKLRHESAYNARSATELAIVEDQMKLIQCELAKQLEAVRKMEQEVERFTDTLNARIEYYRHLQDVSDMVANYEGTVNDAALARIGQQEEALRSKLSAAEAKHRYLVHLKESDSPDEQRTCVICDCQFSAGVLTVCGHQFCKSCIGLWLTAHHNCPICKQALNRRNLHDTVLKPQELKIHSEHSSGKARENGVSPASKQKSRIYSDFSAEKLAAIKNIDLQGPNYTTKVDTMVRHIYFLRETDPGAKCLIFSQYKEFLDVLAVAFRRYQIGYTSFEKAHGIANFKEDPGIEVFLLHARAHSSGLNLVNANHVFLCEPLLNTALELQAIARVDRIGQQRETTVWLYIVDGTVEQSIHNLSVQRRMEHMGRSLKGKARTSTPELLDSSLETANSLELQQAQLSKLMGRGAISGEAVDKKYLWACLFGHASERAA